jgi:hypothetical protein
MDLRDENGVKQSAKNHELGFLCGRYLHVRSALFIIFHMKMIPRKCILDASFHFLYNNHTRAEIIRTVTKEVRKCMHCGTILAHRSITANKFSTRECYDSML